jgi:hypothetical protein
MHNPYAYSAFAGVSLIQPDVTQMLYQLFEWLACFGQELYPSEIRRLVAFQRVQTAITPGLSSLSKDKGDAWANMLLEVHEPPTSIDHLCEHLCRFFRRHV